MRMSRLLLCGILIYTCLFLAFYPPLCGIEDEQGFVNQAIFWSKGGVSAEGAGLSPHLGDLMKVNGVHLPMRHPGRSLVVLPFYWVGGYHAIFISGMFLHLCLAICTAMVLNRAGVSTAYALLALFHPTLLLYSRTIMADAPAGLGLMLSVYALAGQGPLKRRDLILAGLGVSLAATMRHHAVAALPALLWAVWWRERSVKPVICVTMAAAVGALPLMGFNLAVYGSLADPFSAQRGVFGIEFLREQIPFYAAALSVFWPLMFLAPLFARGGLRVVLCGICGTFLGLLGCYYFHDTAAGRIQTFILGLRLMQVTLPCWIIAYIIVLERWRVKYNRYFSSRTQRFISWGFLMLSTVMTTALFAQHSGRLHDYAQRRHALLKAVPEKAFILNEGMMPKLLGIYRPDQPDYEFHLVTFTGHRSYGDREIRENQQKGVPIFLLMTSKNPGERPSPTFEELVERLDAEEIKTDHPLVRLWKPRRAIP